MNCAIALEPAPTQLASQKHAYSSSSTKVVSSSGWKDFFFNNDPRGDCPPDSSVTCKLLKPGCIEPYTGLLTIDPATGKIESPQDEDNGYNETVCIQCTNGDGSIINKDNWNVEQTSNCALAKVKVIPDTKVEYDFLYWSHDWFVNGIRFRKINIDFLKSRWDIEKVHCLDQI